MTFIPNIVPEQKYLISICCDHFNLYVWFGKVPELQGVEEYLVSISFQEQANHYRVHESSYKLPLMSLYLICNLEVKI